MVDQCLNPEHRDAIFKGRCGACEATARCAEALKRFQEGCWREIHDLLADGGRGLQRHEFAAEPGKIPISVIEAIPQRFKDGNLSVGFGLGGGTGIGKTQAVAGLLIQGLVTFGRTEIEPNILESGERRKNFPCVCWSSWVDEVHWLRSHAISGAEDRVGRLATASVLVLDDLGRERIKGDYTQDYGTSQLDFIINSRYRAGLSTIWTTNVPIEDLVTLYGAAMVRRLNEPNPMVWVKDHMPFNRIKRPL